MKRNNKMDKKTITKFGDYPIRTTYDLEGKIRISLIDLCMLLKQDVLLRNGEAIKVCPSCLKIVFRKNGKESWGIKPADIHALLRPLWKESTLPHSLLKDLENWANQLIEREMPVQHKSEAVELFYREDFPVSFIYVGDRVMVNTTQITTQYGKLPSEWLRIASTDKLRRDMEKAGKAGTYNTQIFTTRGRGKGATWLEASLAIELARWVAPNSDLADWCAQQTAEMEVGMPRVFTPKRTIVKQPSERSVLLNDPMPDNLKDALSMITNLRKFIEENSPKIEFYEEFIENRDWFKSTRIADELNISPHQLHQFLSEEGICKYENRHWVVFDSYRTWQCDVPYIWTNSFGKAYTFGSTKRWTQYGREGILELWYNKHPESQL